MSAFIVSQEHIAAVVAGTKFTTYGYSYRWDGESRKDLTPQQLGQKLLDQNVASVNYRYDETCEKLSYYHRVEQHTPVQTIKLCDSYMYQASETPDWLDTEAYAIVQSIREAAISALPGMSDAEWTI